MQSTHAVATIPWTRCLLPVPSLSMNQELLLRPALRGNRFFPGKYHISREWFLKNSIHKVFLEGGVDQDQGQHRIDQVTDELELELLTHKKH